jgi:hypothetical protein
MAHTKFRTAAIAILFLAIIFFPLVNDQLKLVKDIASRENRALALKPELKLSHLDPFPGQYEKYYSDQFSLRFRLVNLYSRFQLGIFKTSPIPDQALVGKEGWFFYAGDEQSAYTGTDRFSSGELDSLAQELTYRKEYIEKRGGRFYFAITPVKNVIYTEYQPSSAYPLFPDSRGEQALRYLQQNTQVNTINLFDVLRKGKSDELRYYKRDNHWTPYGGFLAANEMLSRIHQDFPSVVPERAEDYTFLPSGDIPGNVAEMFGIDGLKTDTTRMFEPRSGFRSKWVPQVPYPCPAYFPYPQLYEYETETGDTTRPRLLLITDSFGVNVFPVLAEKFNRSVKIFDSWDYHLHPDILAKEQADVVILMPSEAFLRHIIQRSEPHLP